MHTRLVMNVMDERALQYLGLRKEARGDRAHSLPYHLDGNPKGPKKGPKLTQVYPGSGHRHMTR